LAGYDTELFGKLNENAQKELEASAKFIYTILKEVQLPDSFNLAPSPFFEVEKSNPLFKQKFKSWDAGNSHLHPFCQHYTIWTSDRV